jgi:hypothetical protein
MAYEKNHLFYDYGGFPPEMYKLQWNSVGSAAVANRAAELLNKVKEKETGRRREKDVLGSPLSLSLSPLLFSLLSTSPLSLSFSPSLISFLSLSLSLLTVSLSRTTSPVVPSPLAAASIMVSSFPSN